MDELISKASAIDAINKALDRETLLNSFVRKVAVDAVKVLPPAQPSVTDTNVRSRATEADDLINRKDTIRAIEAEKVAHGDYTTSSYVGYEFAEEVVESMPSAQPEYTAVTPEEVAAEVACGSINSSIYWGNILMQIEKMGYVICRRMT